MSTPSEPQPTATQGGTRNVAQLRASIARRKRLDRLFFITGGTIIIVSLGVLALLFANLVREGWGAMTQTYQTKADESGFGRNDIGGTLRRSGDQWVLEVGSFLLEGVDETPEVLSLVGQNAAVRGRVRGGNEPEVRVRQLGAAGAVKDVALTGKLSRDEIPAEVRDLPPVVRYTLSPEPLRVDISAIPEAEKSALVEGSNVAMRVEDDIEGNAFVASGVSPLVTRHFFNSFPSREAREAGILSAWVGTMLVMIVTMLAAIPLGIAAGVYLEEYAAKNRITSIIEVNIANLAGVPSIIWGLMALGLFVYMFGLGRSILTAGLTLGLLVLPIVIIATREAIRSIPNTIREASIGLGATKWQTIRNHILPYSMPGILTGSIIAMSRAIGETAPLVTIGALTFIAFLPRSPIPPVAHEISNQQWAEYQQAVAVDPSTPEPQPEYHLVADDWLGSEFTVMPIQLFQWVSRPQREFHENAAATGVVLLAMTLGLNALAITLRYRLRRGLKW